MSDALRLLQDFALGRVKVREGDDVYQAPAPAEPEEKTFEVDMSPEGEPLAFRRKLPQQEPAPYEVSPRKPAGQRIGQPGSEQVPPREEFVGDQTGPQLPWADAPATRDMTLPGAVSSGPMGRAERARFGMDLEPAKFIPEDRPNDPLAAPEDAELADAQRAASKRRRMGLLGMAASGFADAMTPREYRDTNQSRNFWETYVRGGDQRVADLQTRRKSALDIEKQRNERQALADSKDPNSNVSRTVQGFISTYVKDDALKQQLKGKSAYELKQIFPWVDEVIKAGIQRGQQPKVDDDPSSPNNVAWRRSLEASGQYDGQIAALKAAGQWDTLTMKVGQDLQNSWEAENTRRSNERVAKENAAASRAFTDDQRRQHEGFLQSQKDEQDMQELTKATRDDQVALDTLDDVEKIIAENGGVIPGTGFVEGRLPPRLQSVKGNSVRQKLQQIWNDYFHTVGGAAISPSEQKRYNAVLGDLTSSDAELKVAIADLKQHMRKRIDTLRGGYRDMLSRREPPRPADQKPPLKTRKLKNGKTAYQGRKSGDWFTTPEEAEEF